MSLKSGSRTPVPGRAEQTREEGWGRGGMAWNWGCELCQEPRPTSHSVIQQTFVEHHLHAWHCAREYHREQKVHQSLPLVELRFQLGRRTAHRRNKYRGREALRGKIVSRMRNTGWKCKGPSEKVTCEQSLKEGREEPCRNLREGHFRQWGSSMCKGPELGLCLGLWGAIRRLCSCSSDGREEEWEMRSGGWRGRGRLCYLAAQWLLISVAAMTKNHNRVA